LCGETIHDSYASNCGHRALGVVEYLVYCAVCERISRDTGRGLVNDADDGFAVVTFSYMTREVHIIHVKGVSIPPRRLKK